MAKIIDYINCEACNGEGEYDNRAFQALDPMERLRRLDEGTAPPTVGKMNDPELSAHIKCPFCTDGQQPVFECEECEGDGCSECDEEGWYL